ncbi:MAG: hypothetical protein EA385_11415 [Salinarimonadaceae bacterium]|nr:MAG: hypothetical protein EA385_11415 [Salinarimonadaceae bacterium]
MGAMAIDARRGDDASQPEDLFACAGPSEQLRFNAAISPALPAFCDQADRLGWSGREPSSLTFLEADAEVERLSGFFRSLGLRENAIVAVALPNSTEACLTIVALDRAGLTPAFLPVATARETAAQLVESLAAAGVVTQSQIAYLRPASDWRDVAAGYFGLRFPMAFGPGVPDGLIDLDRAASGFGEVSEITPQSADAPPSGFVTFETQDGNLRPVFRSWKSAIAATRLFLATAGYRRGDRVVSLLAQDDFRSLATGLLASLASGSALVAHGLFSSRALMESLADEARTLIVAPGWMEADLARLELSANVANIVLVHRAPVRFKARPPLTHGVVDALAFGETALLAKARDARGQFALSLEPIDGSGEAEALLEARRDETGRISFRGPAAAVSAFGASQADDSSGVWRRSPFAAEIFAGIVIGVSAIDGV